MASRTGWAGLIGLALLSFGPLHAQDPLPEPVRAERLQEAATDVEALRDVRRLHLAYTQLAEVGLWREMADLFAGDAEMIVGARTLHGKAAIAAWIRNELGNGGEGLAPGEVRTLLPLTPVLNLGADGRTAKARWHELAMLGGNGQEARWTGGIYENDYVRQGRVWVIARMHYYPQFAGTYAEGWRNVEPDLKVVPMHYTPQGAGIPFPPADAPRRLHHPALSAQRLYARLAALSDENAIRNLQNIYGYYVDRRMWDDVVDLFEPDGALDIAGLGQWRGTASIRRGLEREGPAGLGAGELNEHVQLPPMVTIAPDGLQARARGLELAMTGRNDGKAYWSVSIYENAYSKRDGVWRIARMGIFPRFRADYAEGWAKSRLEPVAPDPAHRADRPSDAPSGAIPDFSWLHPVTGQPVGRAGHGAFAPASRLKSAPYLKGRFPIRQIDEGERMARILAADIGVENVSNAFGNYIDDFEWRLLSELFARKGAREMPYAGYYIGPSRIAEAEITKWGPRRIPRISIPIHLRIQPVIDVASDGRSAKLRTRLFSIGSSLNSAGSFSGGMYPNDQAVLENGVWKLWSVGIDEFYYNSAGYRNGWTNVPAEPAEKKPDMLLKAFPPDIPLTALGQRQQGFIPGSTLFNPYIHNGPAYPGYPSATPMWFHYANPVSGRIPPYYWPDCGTCKAFPQTGLRANGY